MTSAEILRIHCTALGFLAVILKDEPMDQQALRARTIARLIESFCHVTVPEPWDSSNQNSDTENDFAKIDSAIDIFKMKLRDQGEAHLPEDRPTLLRFYERLQQRQLRRKEKHFYATGSNDLIANRILVLIDEEIEEGVN